MFKKPEVWNVSYYSNELKAFTKEKRGEVGILYFGRRLRNYYLDKTMVGPTPAVNGSIYYFDREESFEIDGVLNVEIEPFYGGFLAKNYEGVCYVRCVRLGKGGIIFPRQIHVAPICDFRLKVTPQTSCIEEDWIKLTLEGGDVLSGEISCEGKTEVRILRINDGLRLKVPETLLETDGGHHEFTWRPSAVERGVVVFGDVVGKGIVKTFRLNGPPYVLSDLTYAGNSTFLEVKSGKKRTAIRLDVDPLRSNEDG